MSLFSGLLALPAWTPWPSMALKTCMTARFVFSPFLRLAFFLVEPSPVFCQFIYDCVFLSTFQIWICFAKNEPCIRLGFFSASQHDIKHDIFMQAISGSGGKSCTLHSGKKPLAIATSFATMVLFAGMFP